ncbi:MAG: RICIN domain-containing protein [Clostridia bacterium]|nr:RICIN domain-containing protein [Clostridia bacterium]
MKKIICILLAFAMFLPCSVFAEDGVKIYINSVILDAEGIITAENRTIVPLRAIFESLNASVDWDDSTKTVTAVRGDTTVALTIGVPQIIKNNSATEIDVAPVIINSSTYVPVRAVSEAFECVVEWHADERAVVISTPFNDADNDDSLDGKYVTLALADGKMIGVEGASSDDSAALSAQNANGDDSQTWEILFQSEGFYTLVNKKSGKAVDMPASDTTPGRGATQYSTNNGANQQLFFEENDDGTYRLKFKHSELYLTNSDGKFTQEAKGDALAQCFTMQIVGEGPMSAIKSTPGYLNLDAETRERFDSYVFKTRSYTTSIYNQARSLIAAENYVEKSAQEQSAILEQCLTFTAFNLVYIGEIPKEGETTYTISNKTYIDSFDVWRGTMLPVWSYDVAMSDGYSVTIYTTIEDCSVVEDGAAALARFPLAIRKYLRRLIHREDTANNYNGGGDTIWIRLSYIPSQNAIAQTLAHELGHVLDTSLTTDDSVWENAALSDRVPVSGYGNSNRAEDLAEFSRLYHMAKRDENIMNALETVYPNRISAYRALLYSGDKEYYAQYKSDYEKYLPFIDAGEEAVYNTITLEGTDLVLGLADDATASGTTVVLEQYTGKETQQWRIRTTKDGYKVIFNKAADCCLNVPGNSTDNGKSLIIWNGGGGNNEKWTMSGDDNGAVFCVKHSNLYLSADTATATATQSQTQSKWIIKSVE